MTQIGNFNAKINILWSPTKNLLLNISEDSSKQSLKL